ncbi:MAG TPA: tRNA epoxyqueuosine(34) reductase QueG [Gemmatimonadales bacterium]|nr:tRNA epoxyqueuosine(34) reductase QueG [Gemmatimonadales bacterium]
MSSEPAPTITASRVKTEANRLGFSACAITSLDPLPHGEQLDRWLASGKAGNMRYLHRQARKRKNPQAADQTARCAIVVLDNYYYEIPEDCTRPKVARYARGQDYHSVTNRRLGLLADFLRQNGAKTARAYTDSGPLAERELAQRAGLGWIGKNTMLIRPGQGSWVFIGSVLTDLELEIDRPFETDHCGSCTRCLEACPTQAFEAPRVLDATRCISYLTIEHRGPIPTELVNRFEGWSFGCDICNEVCPWNVRFATESSVPEFRPRSALADAGPEFFEELDEPEFQARFGDTPLQRPGLDRMRRNWRAAWTSLQP